MPRYLVERTFPEELAVPAGADGAEACHEVIERNELKEQPHIYIYNNKKCQHHIYKNPPPHTHTPTYIFIRSPPTPLFFSHNPPPLPLPFFFPLSSFFKFLAFIKKKN